MGKQRSVNESGAPVAVVRGAGASKGSGPARRPAGRRCMCAGRGRMHAAPKGTREACGRHARSLKVQAGGGREATTGPTCTWASEKPWSFLASSEASQKALSRSRLMWSTLSEQSSELTATIRSSAVPGMVAPAAGAPAAAEAGPAPGGRTWACMPATEPATAGTWGRSARRSARTTNSSCWTICLFAGFSRARYRSSYCASCADVSDRCRADSVTECISLIVSMRLCASSMTTTEPAKRRPSACRVDELSSEAYGSATNWASGRAARAA